LFLVNKIQKTREATDAIGAEMDQAVDTAAVKVDAAIDESLK
jgi:hypothetical protein